MSDAQARAAALKEDIERSCIRYGLNMTIHEGKIGFVDQKEKKIVALWSPEHHLSEVSGDG